MNRALPIAVLLSAVFAYSPYAVRAQAETFGAMRFTAPRGFVKQAGNNSIVFKQVDRRQRRFCYITLFAAAQSAASPKKSFEREWAERVVKTWDAVENPDTQTELWNRSTLVSAGSEIYIGLNPVTAYLFVVTAYGKSASVLGIFNDNSCLDTLQTFAEELEIGK